VGIMKLLLDVRNAGKLVATLSQHRPTTLGLLVVVRARLSIQPLERHASEATQVRPVGGEVQLLKRLLLLLQLFLREIGHRHVACVDCEARLCGCLRRTDVVVGSAAVPDDEIARLHAHFLPHAAFVREPLESSLRETVPLLCPSPDLGLVDELLVELLREQVSALADDQSAVVWSIGQEVDKALEAAEAGLCRVLILVGPRLVCLKIFAVGEGEVDSVEADDQILGVVDLLESSYDTRLLTNSPCPLLVRGAYML
jgi:hypothetical protein